jgi:hypothetical protein
MPASRRRLRSIFLDKRDANVPAQRLLPPALLVLVALSLSGCFYLSGRHILDTNFQELKPDPMSPRIGGLRRLMDETPRELVAVVFVHGGGLDPKRDYSKALRQALAERLRLAKLKCSAENPIGPPETPAKAKATFKVCDYGDPQLRLRFYELYWKPLWKYLWEANLTYDRDNRVGRLWVNDQIKEQLLNERFAEEVLYGGKFRPQMLTPVSDLLCAITNDNFTSKVLAGQLGAGELCAAGIGGPKRIVVVGMSLGSVMLIDGIARPYEKKKPAENPEVQIAAAVIRQMRAVFMLSNQLPVSRLGDISMFPEPATPQPAASKALVGLLEERCKLPTALGTQRGGAEPTICILPPLEIVAVTDPNDVAGYFISAAQIPEGAGLPYATWTNALVHNAHWAIPWLYANAVQAHEDHAYNPDVIDMIACGVPANC